MESSVIITFWYKFCDYIKSCWTVKILIAEVVLASMVFIMLFHTPLSEQYFYYRFGMKLLDDSAFEKPNGTFCLKSALLIEYGNDSYVADEVLSNHLVIYTQVAVKIPRIITTMIIGPLTDKYGRKIGIILPVLGTVLDGIGAFIIVFLNASPYYLILSHGSSGFLGGFPLLCTSVYSYIADVSSPQWRTLRLGILTAALAFGGGAGAFLIGFWLYWSDCNFTTLYLFYSITSMLLLAYTLIIPESIPASKRKRLFDDRNSGIFKMYLEGAKLYCRNLSPRTAWKLYAATLAILVIAFKRDCRSPNRCLLPEIAAFRLQPSSDWHLSSAQGGLWWSVGVDSSHSLDCVQCE